MPEDSDASEVTRILKDWHSGDERAMNKLMPLVYGELQRLARCQMRGERRDHTLQPTALVHEAFARLVDADVDWQDRTHFYSVAARAMRRILVDHARSRARDKRRADGQRVTLEDAMISGDAPPDELIDLDRAIGRLERLDPRKAQLVELHFFAGLTFDELATALAVSRSTVKRDMRLARAWLHRAMAGDAPWEENVGAD